MATALTDLARDPTLSPDADLARRVQEGHNTFLFPAESRLYDEPLVLTRGQGVWVQDAKGDTYLDLFSGILTNSIGQAHPDVVQRVTEQLHTLGHTSTLYLTENEVAMAERLSHIAPGRLSRTFFTNSGTEAVETAIMAAQVYTGRSEI